MFPFLQKLPQTPPAIPVSANPPALVGAALSANAFLQTFGVDQPTSIAAKQENPDLIGLKDDHKVVLSDSDTDAKIHDQPDPKCNAIPAWPVFAQAIDMLPPQAFGLLEMAPATAVVVDQPPLATDAVATDAVAPHLGGAALARDNTGLLPAMAEPDLVAQSGKNPAVDAAAPAQVSGTPAPPSLSRSKVLHGDASSVPALLNTAIAPQTIQAVTFSAEIKGNSQSNPAPTPAQIDADNGRPNSTQQIPRSITGIAAIASGELLHDAVQLSAKSETEHLFSAVESAWRQKWMGDEVQLPVPPLRPFDAADVENSVDLPQLSPLGPKIVLAPDGDRAVSNTAAQATSVLSSDFAGPKQTSHHAQYLPQVQTNDPKGIDMLAPNGRIIPTNDAALDDWTDRVHDVGRVAQSLGHHPQIANLTTLVGLTKSDVNPVVAPTIIQMAKAKNAGPVELSLSPEELGRLTISMKYHGDFVHVTVNADRPETLDLMRRHANELVADLRQAGFAGSSLSFGQGAKGQHPQATAAPILAEAPIATQLSAPETSAPRPVGPTNSSGIDLRF